MQLVAAQRQGFPRIALRFGFAQANDGDQVSGKGGFGLGLYLRIRLSVVSAAFGMAQDHMACARVLQHGGRNIARMRARRLGVAILPADVQRFALRVIGRLGDQSGGGAQQHLAGRGRVGGQKGAHLVQSGRRAVHLPIASGEFFHSGLLLLQAGLAKRGAFGKLEKVGQAAV